MPRPFRRSAYQASRCRSLSVPPLRTSAVKPKAASEGPSTLYEADRRGERRPDDARAHVEHMICVFMVPTPFGKGTSEPCPMHVSGEDPQNKAAPDGHDASRNKGTP